MPCKIALFCCIFFSIVCVSLGANRCASDAVYSYRVCSALTSFMKSKRQQCDLKELNRLRQRVQFLQGILNALRKEPNAMKNRNAQSKPTCRNGVEYERACYFMLDDDGQTSMKTYEEAESACQSKQAKLATMDNQPMYEALYNYVAKNAQDFVDNARNLVIIWTGASYENRRIILGNNQTSHFSNWSSYHPLNVTARNKIAVAIATNPQVRGMFDALPAMKFYPLCKKKLKSKAKSAS